MSNIDSIKKLDHHAYCISGGEAVQGSLLQILAKKHKAIINNNPDFVVRKYSNFLIDDAREIKRIHDSRPVGTDGKKYIILDIDNITKEAQNALLKLLEEPAEYAHFFLIVRSVDILLDTVRSRLQFINIGADSVSSNKYADEIKAFIRYPLNKRLEFIKKFVDDISKEKRSKRDAIDFLDELELALYSTKSIKNDIKIFEAIDLVRKYIYDRAPSFKMLMEYVALNM